MPKPIGRPKKHRDSVLIFRLVGIGTRPEGKLVKDAARLSGESRSELIRRGAVREAREIIARAGGAS